MRRDERTQRTDRGTGFFQVMPDHPILDRRPGIERHDIEGQQELLEMPAIFVRFGALGNAELQFRQGNGRDPDIPRPVGPDVIGYRWVIAFTEVNENVGVEQVAHQSKRSSRRSAKP